ncbi:hypothetical protein SAMN04488483_2677 [Pseudomonas helmanticensis]|uniref:Uncharacterized protein n=1 Tax=Pseudomonas helmanticensis TaxID=1471381 RepID=A0ACD2U5Z9_9PSED|nr:hypothetical protein [Pseudomonas helmanticensis]SMQ25975.1 hypothetical protein SAMN04488483_2677 [Pseudomonas helmanticensis]
MTRAELMEFLEIKINEKAQIILDEDMVHDGAALGEMQIYFCFRRILNKKATLEDVGALHAVNKVLQALGVLAAKETLRSRVEK